MKRATFLTCLVLPFVVSACGAPSDAEGPPPVATAESAAALTPVPGTFCAAHVANLEDIVLGLAVTYVQTAFSDISACSIDNYFLPGFEEDGLKSYLDNQLIPWLLYFWQCPDAEPVPFGLIPQNDPPFTVTATDFYAVVNTFLAAASLTGPVQHPDGSITIACSFGFSQEQIARMNVMLYALASQVVNDGNAGLTHGDPGCTTPVTPVDVLSACVPE